MSTMVSSNGLAVAVQLPAKFRRPCLHSYHAVGGIGAGPQRLRPLPHPVASDGYVALGAGSQRDGRGDDYGGHSDFIQWISEHFLRPLLPRPRHVRGGVHLLQAQLRLGHDGCGGVRGIESGDGAGRRLRDQGGEGTVHQDCRHVRGCRGGQPGLQVRTDQKERGSGEGRELQRERIELSQTIHDTIAQSAYMIGLGLETAIELANAQNDEGRNQLIAKLEATHALSKSTMWELRHPIDAGPIFEGRELSRVLRSHASTFTTITSIPTGLVQPGREPQLSTVTRGLLFSIAHNAMTNAFRHSHAGKVTIALSFGGDRLRMSVSDDGIGLPDDYEDRGHGFRRMRTDAERMGGSLEAGPGESGRGTTVTCVVPYDTKRGGA